MKKYIRYIFLISAAVFVAYQVTPIFHLLIETVLPISINKMPSKNPTSYTFSSTITKVKDVTTSIFKPRFMRKDEYLKSLNFRTANKVNSSILFSATTTSDRIILTMLSPIKSPVYSTALGKLPYLSKYKLNFKLIKKNQTRVTITPFETKVLKGVTCCGPHLFYKKSINVSATTIEEYKILKYIGYHLNETSMPDTITP